VIGTSCARVGGFALQVFATRFRSRTRPRYRPCGIVRECRHRGQYSRYSQPSESHPIGIRGRVAHRSAPVGAPSAAGDRYRSANNSAENRRFSMVRSGLLSALQSRAVGRQAPRIVPQQVIGYIGKSVVGPSSYSVLIRSSRSSILARRVFAGGAHSSSAAHARLARGHNAFPHRSSRYHRSGVDAFCGALRIAASPSRCRADGRSCMMSRPMLRTASVVQDQQLLPIAGRGTVPAVRSNAMTAEVQIAKRTLVMSTFSPRA